ncbi:hypothetical protein GALMADRAFT_136032 [Galerina marginata CBS 339.88]|uniref:F-box domain-containing protein n=1 Tax=Galerina marginata (strain CBS 339.88) TaxID=685588 RepID=A0A067TCQ8_GALM3|nr:hypothetical protein GALMADRAFT_136032 [Galerina marginata CBS 339.88]
MVSLPQELVDIILVNLGLYVHHEPAGFALRSCLLVSAAFAASSRRHLFRSVEINGARHPDIFSRAKALKDIISPNSAASGDGVAQYIKEFTIKLDEKQSRPDGLRWLLADILDNLHNESYGIDELTLHGIQSNYGINHGNVGISWSGLGSYFNSAFVALCQSPRLRKLKITGIFCIPPTLFDGTFINGLHLSYITFSYADLLGGPRLPRPQLDLLETNSVCPNIIDNLVADPSFVSHIRDLRFLAGHDTPQANTRHRHRLIAMSGKVIKHLCVTIASCTP